MAGPTIFWVTGAATDIGKTTVATALLRCLGARSIPALGFKPIAATLLRAYADRAHTFESLLPGRIVNIDCLALARASPLTSVEDADLITPWQLLCYRASDDTLLIRAGSAALGNVRFFTTSAMRTLLQRPDLARLMQALKLAAPLEAARVFDPATEPRGELAAEVQARAFSLLLQRRPEAVVVEAAGPLLPTWKGCPALNHLIALTHDEILLYPHLNLEVPTGRGNRRGYSTQLLEALDQRGLHPQRIDHCIVEAPERDAMMQRMLATLLAKAGL